MASTYSDLKIELIGTGEQVGTWGSTTNTNLGTAIEEAIVGSADVSFSSADVTLTLTNTNASQSARHLRLNLTGTSGGARNLILGSGCQIDKPYIINNGLADAVTVKNTTGTGVAVPAGKSMWVFNNGTNVVEAITHTPVSSGGTGVYTLTANNVILGNGTSAVQFVAPGSNGNVLTSNGTTWTSAAVPASGDVVGPASSTDNAIARFDSTTGKLIQNSSATVDDNGAGTFVGAVNVSGTSSAGANIKLYEDTDNGTNFVSLKSPDSVSSDLTFTLPSSDGTSGQVLSTNGSGLLSFVSRLASTDFTGANQSLTADGWQIFPGGLMIQWGYASAALNFVTQTVSFPTTFPNACLAVITNPILSSSSGLAAGYWNITGFNTTSFTTQGTVTRYYIAIGY